MHRICEIFDEVSQRCESKPGSMCKCGICVCVGVCVRECVCDTNRRGPHQLWGGQSHLSPLISPDGNGCLRVREREEGEKLRKNVRK